MAAGRDVGFMAIKFDSMRTTSSAVLSHTKAHAIKAKYCSSMPNYKYGNNNRGENDRNVRDLQHRVALQTKWLNK